MATTTATFVSLESGDRLTRQEFHRRYCARPDIKKAELIEGVVYVPSPVRVSAHGRPHIDMAGWLYAYAATRNDTDVADNATVILDNFNELQPDVCLFWSQPHGGGALVNSDDYIEGAPQLVAEIAASSVSSTTYMISSTCISGTA